MGLLDNIEIQESGDSLFMHFQTGDNRFRMLDKPTLGYLYWDDKVPVRIKTASEAPTGEKPKVVWVCPVWNENQVRILEIKQSTIQKALKSLEDNAEWGNLTEYDVIVAKSGDGLETSYVTTPCPKAPLPDNVKPAFKKFMEDYDPDKIFNGKEQDDELPF